MEVTSVESLIEKIQRVVLYDGEGLIGSAKDQIEGILRELILLKASFSRELFSKKRSGSQVLVDNIRSVVERAEDVIDEFVIEKRTFKASYKKPNSLTTLHQFSQKKKREKLTLHQVAEEIEYIRKEIDQHQLQASRFKEALQLKQTQHHEAAAFKDKPPATDEDYVVGFDEEAKTVIKRLNGDTPDLDIITICGMGGLGKTTLARKIYNDPAIEYEFFTRVWVHVSRNYTKKEVFLSILAAFKQPVSDYTYTPDYIIAEEVHKFLEKRKYLIVMDDVWTSNDFNDLGIAFPNNKKGSRILITSRNKEVARYANPTGEPHNLKFLSPYESWELLESKVFGKGKCPENGPKSLGQHIAAECEGLPLAIVVITGILLNNHEYDDWWEQVAENVNKFFVTDGTLRKVIAMSYSYLPYHLKSCFLYLGVFPKDYEIPVWILIRLWIAEGFIEQDREISLEDIAEACLTDLVRRNLLMASQRRSSGQIKTCRVHSILHHFCKMEARKQNFYHEITRFDKEARANCRRTCVHSDIMDYMHSKPQGEHVRSFLCYPTDEITLPGEVKLVILEAYKLLRVLDIKSITFHIFPDVLLQLALLRYLALSCNIEALPRGISKLWNMETLIFLTTTSSLEFSEEVWKMHHLRHLHTNSSALLPRPPLGITRGIENVQTLSMISPESCTEQVFAMTPNLKNLGVKGKLILLSDESFDQIGKLQHLTNLKLYDESGHSEGRLHKLPRADKFPKKLKNLTLSNTLLDWDEMQILGSLETLEVLKLKNNAFKGDIWEPKDGGFVSLKFLHIGRTNLVTWKASQRHFPSLKHLVLQHCENLAGIPSGFAEINSFQVLELYSPNPRTSFSARKIQHRKMVIAVKETKTCGVFKLSVCPPDM